MALLIPDVAVAKVTEITPELLRRMGVRALILDADNTLSAHGAQQPFEGVRAWLEAMRAEGFAMIMVSNNFEKRIRPFAESLGLAFIAMAMKPFTSGFRRALKSLGVPACETAALGDQVFTDILGANLAGLRSVLLVPQGEESGSSLALRRVLEGPVRRRAMARAPELAYPETTDNTSHLNCD